VTAVPRYNDLRTVLADYERRIATLERGQRSTAALAARVDELEDRVEALEEALAPIPPEPEP
jgi:polyhydroxyalkanoate synthesis regulator phasin